MLVCQFAARARSKHYKEQIEIRPDLRRRIGDEHEGKAAIRAEQAVQTVYARFGNAAPCGISLSLGHPFISVFAFGAAMPALLSADPDAKNISIPAMKQVTRASGKRQVLERKSPGLPIYVPAAQGRGEADVIDMAM